MAFPTLLDIAKQNGSDATVGLIDETIKLHPELQIGAARTIAGLNYKTLVRVALGNTAGSFRHANEGVAPHVHRYENRLVETFILNPRWECDKAIADKHEDGPAAYIALEAAGTLEGEMQALARQFYYGPGANGNAKGFPGLIQSYDAANMVVDAGGTTDNTASSVWLVRFGPKNVQWVWGANGQLEPSEVRVESVIPDASRPTEKFDAYVQTMLAYPGVQVGSLWSAARIKKLTADAGKGLTDALLYKALALFPAGTRPDAIFMSRRSREQWRASRTATNATGAPAPIPDNFEGIPVYATDSILDTETLTL